MKIQATPTMDILSKSAYLVDHLHGHHESAVALDSRIRIPELRSSNQLTTNMTDSASEQAQINNNKIENVLSNGTETQQNTQSEIKIELIEEKDAAEVLAMLKEFFFKDEPMNTYLDLGECEELEEYSLQSISSGCSFKAVNSSGKIVGVFLNEIVNKPQTHDKLSSYSSKCKHPKFKKILQMFEYVEHNFNVFDLYPNIDRYMDGKILSVNSNYRGYGIAGKLTERTVQYMRANNIPVIHVMCSSHFSARVCEKLNFQTVYELPFVDYVVDGENPIVPAAPHTAIRILVKEIV